MGMEKIILESAPETMYLYQVEKSHNLDKHMKITETPVQVKTYKEVYYTGTWKDKVIKRECVYYQTVDTEIKNRITVSENNMGILINSSKMLLKSPNKEYYMKTLKNKYIREYKSALKSVERFNNYVTYLDTELSKSENKTSVIDADSLCV